MRNRFLRYIAAATFSFFLAIASPASGAEQAIVPLTPQQEAFFPKNDPIDEEFWKRFTSPSQFNETWQIHKKLGSRFRYIFFGTVYAGLCNDYAGNLLLVHGPIVGGCDFPDISPRHRHKDKFSSIKWQTVNPRDHLEVIRAMYLARQPTDPVLTMKVRPDLYWYKMGPVIRRLLLRNGVVLRKADLDISQTGAPVPVYALSLLPQEICLKPDRTTTYSTTAYYADAHDTVSQGFNREPFGGDAFLYEGKLYFTAGEGLITSANSLPDGHGGRVFQYGPDCEFQAEDD